MSNKKFKGWDVWGNEAPKEVKTRLTDFEQMC